ncbi:MAG: pyridoxamine 5'-phosphate oxidase family protein [Thermodesulfobacteriota bacterium]
MSSPDPLELIKQAEELIRQVSTMTISTATRDEPWAAPVYFASRGFLFYFFSDPGSRHVQEGLKSGRAAAAIYPEVSSWRDIRGVQMSGSLNAVQPGLEALRAIHAYLQKFPFTREFFDRQQKIDLEAFAGTFKVRLYVFKPALLYYLDNRIRFSFRESIPLP